MALCKLGHDHDPDKLTSNPLTHASQVCAFFLSKSVHQPALGAFFSKKTKTPRMDVYRTAAWLLEVRALASLCELLIMLLHSFISVRFAVASVHHPQRISSLKADSQHRIITPYCKHKHSVAVAATSCEYCVKF